MATLTNVISNATGNVGIGTISPASKLSIVGSAAATNFKSLILRNGDGTVGSAVSIDFETSAGTIGDEAAMAARISGIRLGGGTTGGLIFSTTDNGNLGERVRILNNGAVGIGTTSPSLISGYIGLNVVNAGYTQIKLQSNASSAGIEFKPSSGNSWELQANNSNQWFIYDRTQSVYRLIIDVNGNVGIGATPIAPLDVQCNTGGTGIILRGRADNSTALRFYANNGTTQQLYIGTDDSNIDFNSVSTRPIRFIVNDLLQYQISQLGVFSWKDGAGGDRMRLNSTGLGIGTTSPVAKLDVSGSAIRSFVTAGGGAEPGFIVDYPSSNGYGAFFVHVNNTRRWRIGSVGDTNVQPALNFWQEGTGSRMIINNLGNVGIGTYAPAGQLDVYSSGGASGYVRSSVSAIRLLAYGDGTNWIQSGTSTSNSSADLIFSSMNGSSQWMRIQGSTGNVGIGTSSPGHLLSIYGTPVLDGALNVVQKISSNASYLTAPTSGIGFGANWASGGNNAVLSGIAGGKENTNNSDFAGVLIFYTRPNGGNHTERMRITSTGNVGIGTTSPSSRLQVVSGSGSPTLLLGRANGHSSIKAGATSQGGYLALDSDGTASGALILNHYVSDNVWLVTGGGNVGIGTTSPGSKLNAYGSGSNLSVFKVDGGNGTLFEVTDRLSGSLFSVNTIAGIPVLEVFSNNTIVAGQYGSNVFVITGSRVGIGTSVPTNTLTVAGSANVTGALTKGSGTFLIDHPDPNKPGWKLQHSFVESPTVGDNIYRYEITINNSLSGSIELPSYWKFLNENPQIWISPVKHFGVAYGEINEEVSGMNVYANNAGKYNVLLIGTRKDPTIKRLMPEFNVEFESQ